MALAPFFWCGAYFPTLVKNPAVKIDQTEGGKIKEKLTDFVIL